MRKLCLAASLCILLSCSPLMAQSESLALTIRNIYGPKGLTLPNSAHNAHFNSDFEASFNPLNSNIATQLTLLPLISPAAGFLYEFDRSLGVPVRSENQSFGSILTERGETVGKNRFLLGFAYQRFDFQTMDGLDLQNFGTVYHHVATTSPYGADFITANNKINLTINQFTPYFTLGVTNRVDVSVAIPLLNVSLNLTSAATIHRIAANNPGAKGTIEGEAHFFDATDIPNSTQKTFTNSGSASGVGDTVVRVKGTVWKGESAALAVVADLRAPTGDAMNLLGSGAVGFKPFMAFSFHKSRFSPHVNAGYEWNGDSVLAGDVTTLTKAHLPNQFIYAAGTSVRASKAITLAFDILGQRVIDGYQAKKSVFTSPNNRSDPTVTDFPDVSFSRSSFNIVNGAAGIKLSPAKAKNLLVTLNALFKLNDAGLRAKVVPLFGISYTF